MATPAAPGDDNTSCKEIESADRAHVERDAGQRQKLRDKGKASESGTVSIAFKSPLSVEGVKTLAERTDAAIEALTTTYYPDAQDQNFTSTIETRGRSVDEVAVEWRLRMTASMARRAPSLKPVDLAKSTALKTRIEQGELPIAGVRLMGEFSTLQQLADDPTVFSLSLDAIDARLPDDAATIKARELACGGEGR